MHLHASQFNPNAQMNALYAARADAELAAAQTRKKLTFSASAVVNDIDGESDCVVSLSGDDARGQSNGQDSQDESSGQQESAQDDGPFSDWA